MPISFLNQRCHLSEAFSRLLVSPCIWPARLTFDLTNQYTEAGKNCTVLTSMQLFLIRDGTKYLRTMSDCKKWKL